MEGSHGSVDVTSVAEASITVPHEGGTQYPGPQVAGMGPTACNSTPGYRGPQAGRVGVPSWEWCAWCQAARWSCSRNGGHYLGGSQAVLLLI